MALLPGYPQNSDRPRGDPFDDTGVKLRRRVGCYDGAEESQRREVKLEADKNDKRAFRMWKF